MLPVLMRAVEDKVAVIRGFEVIADADVAALYGVQNNKDKFPPHDMFELSKSELKDLRSKILTTNVSVMNSNSTKVFTERGLYMLAMP